MGPAARLRTVRILHTVVWAVFAGAILAIPVFAFHGDVTLSAGLVAFVFLEVAVLWTNGMRCPLTDVAARCTTDRRANFDICLPEWLARFNKQIFGLIYVAGILCTLYAWASSRMGE